MQIQLFQFFLLLFVVLICIGIIYRSRYYGIFNEKESFVDSQCHPADTLFTCTTYVTLPKKYQELRKALTTFLEYNQSTRIGEYIVINEYDPKSQPLIDKLKKEFPQIKFWNKKKHQKGQAKSLNMIIEYLKNKNYTYWLQWEESWFCLGAFITKMYTIMDNSQIDQLCLQYNHWNADRKNERYDHLEYIDHPNYVEIKVNGRLDENPIGQNCKKLVPQHKYTVPYWPLFTLRPTMNRVSTILKCKYFDTQDSNWPVFFEYMYSCEWIKHNVRIACFREKYVTRKKNHKSTYSKSNLNRIK